MRKKLEKVLKEKKAVWKEFCQEEAGVGIVEVILILVNILTI